MEVDPSISHKTKNEEQMKSRVRDIAQLIAVAIVAVVSSGCSQESVPDPSTTTQDYNQIGFSPYTPTMTSKATVVDNTTILDHGFNVGVYVARTTDIYIPCTHVLHDSDLSLWRYVDDNNNFVNRYWPADNSTHLTFLAHYPKGNEEDIISSDGDTYLFGNERYEAFSDSDSDLAFKFGYTVANSPDDQFDLIYALREDVECPAISPYSIELPFCHALTQVAFTAQLDTDLQVDMRIYKIVLHNLVYTGTFAAKDDTSKFNNNGVWWYSSSTAADAVTDKNDYLISQFSTDVLYDGVTSENGFAVSEGTKLPEDGSQVNITNPKNPAMLMPQHISPWVVESFKPSYTDYTDYTTIERTDGSTGLDPAKAGAYIAISCEITQEVEGEHIRIHSKDNWLYAPLTTAITYPDGTLGNGGGAADTNEWVAGYKITYNLLFGGGYSTIPGAEYPVQTLSEMTITAAAEAWEDGGSVDLEY